MPEALRVPRSLPALVRRKAHYFPPDGREKSERAIIKLEFFNTVKNGADRLPTVGTTGPGTASGVAELAIPSIYHTI